MQHEHGRAGRCDCPYGQGVTSANTVWQWGLTVLRQAEPVPAGGLPPHPEVDSSTPGWSPAVGMSSSP